MAVKVAGKGGGHKGDEELPVPFEVEELKKGLLTRRSQRHKLAAIPVSIAGAVSLVGVAPFMESAQHSGGLHAAEGMLFFGATVVTMASGLVVASPVKNLLKKDHTHETDPDSREYYFPRQVYYESKEDLGIGKRKLIRVGKLWTGEVSPDDMDKAMKLDVPVRPIDELPKIPEHTRLDFIKRLLVKKEYDMEDKVVGDLLPFSDLIHSHRTLTAAFDALGYGPALLYDGAGYKRVPRMREPWRRFIPLKMTEESEKTAEDEISKLTSDPKLIKLLTPMRADVILMEKLLRAKNLSSLKFKDFTNLLEDHIADYPLAVQQPSQPVRPAKPSATPSGRPRQPSGRPPAQSAKSSATLTVKSREQGSVVVSEPVVRVVGDMVTVGGVSARRGVVDEVGSKFVPVVVLEPVVEQVGLEEDMLEEMLLGNNVLLVGDTGTGKTDIVQNLCRLLNWPCTVLSLSEGTREKDLLVRRGFNGQTVDEDSPLIVAMRHGFKVILDETNMPEPGVLASLNNILAAKRVTLPSGEVVKAKEGFGVFATMNPDNYEGTQDMNIAFLRRFAVFNVDYPGRESELKILRKFGPDVDVETMERVVNAANDFRFAFREGVLPRPMDLGATINCIRYFQRFPEQSQKDAFDRYYNVAVMEPDSKDVVDKILDKYGFK